MSALEAVYRTLLLRSTTAGLSARAHSSCVRAASSSSRVPLSTPYYTPSTTKTQKQQQQRSSFSSVISSLARQDDQPTAVVAHDKYGFNVNGIHMRGSILAFNNFTMLWNMQHAVAITPRSLAAVHMIRPKPGYLIIGLPPATTSSSSSTTSQNNNVNPALYAYFSRKGIAVEAMTTIHAISTFNMLVQEGRLVCAALISRSPMSRDDASLFLPDAHLHAAATSTPAGRKDAEILQILGNDVLPADRQRLLTDGAATTIVSGNSSNSNNSSSGFQVASTTLAPSSSSSSTSKHSSKTSPTAPTEPIILQEAEAATKYGYPGALPPDPSPVNTLAVTIAARRAAQNAAIVRGDSQARLERAAGKSERKSGGGK